MNLQNAVRYFESAGKRISIIRFFYFMQLITINSIKIGTWLCLLVFRQVGTPKNMVPMLSKISNFLLTPS